MDTGVHVAVELHVVARRRDRAVDLFDQLRITQVACQRMRGEHLVGLTLAEAHHLGDIAVLEQADAADLRLADGLGRCRGEPGDLTGRFWRDDRDSF